LVGFVNLAIGNHKGTQVGFVNWNSESFSGVQAGFVNTVGGDFSGVQLGFVNTNIGQTNGFQASFMNTNIGETRGAQMAFLNTSIGHVYGPQIGFVNIAAQGVNGVQFGFVNYTDNIDNGVPIGFLSIVRKGGYRALEISFNEYYSYNASFKIGIDRFYTSIFAAYNYTENMSFHNFASGFGFGSLLPIGKLFFFNPELNSISSVVNLDETSVNFTSFVPYFGVKVGRLSIIAGPSITWVSTTNDEEINRRLKNTSGITVPDIKRTELPEPLFSLYSYDINESHKIVVGARAALRIRL